MGDSLNPKTPSGSQETNPGGAQEAASNAPLVLIPVSAEDVAQRGRRIKLAWITGLAVLALIAGWMYKRSTDPIRAQQAYDAAQRLFNVARYDQAIVSCDRAISLKADFTDAYLLRGRARVAYYDPAGAVEDFSKAVQLRPHDAQPLLERAAALVDQKKYAAALADAAAALTIEPKLARAYNIRGTAMRGMGDVEGAIAEFGHAVEIEPNSNNYYQRGATYQLLPDHVRAVEDFTQAIAWDPDSPQTYFARAESERALGQTKEADEDHLHGRILDGQ